MLRHNLSAYLRCSAIVIKAAAGKVYSEITVAFVEK